MADVIRACVARDLRGPSSWSVEDVVIEEPDTAEVIVEVSRVSLCRSDLNVLTGRRPKPVPIVLGHEAVGKVVRCGTEVEKLQPGQRVSFSLVPACGSCPACDGGTPGQCTAGRLSNAEALLPSGEYRIRTKCGEGLHQYMGIGALAEAAVVSAKSVVPFEASISDDEAALLSCAGVTGVGAVRSFGYTPETVVVVGVGAVGLFAAMAALATGVGTVVAVDPEPARLRAATSVGCTHVVSARDPNAVDLIRRVTSGGGHQTIESAGAPGSLELAVAATRPGGVVTALGLSDKGESLKVATDLLVGRDLTISGAYIGRSDPMKLIPDIAKDVEAGRLPVKTILEPALPLSEAALAARRSDRLHVVRQLIDPQA